MASVIPLTKLYAGEILSASAEEGDPTEVTYSAFGTAVWNHADRIEVHNKVAWNPRTKSVQTISAAPGDLCFIWVRPNGEERLVICSDWIPFDDCPGSGGSAPMSANDELRKKGGIIVPDGDGNGPRQPGGGSPPISGGGVVTR